MKQAIMPEISSEERERSSRERVVYEVLGKKRLDLPKADGLEQVYTNKDPD
jgi:hypothetical protein